MFHSCAQTQRLVSGGGTLSPTSSVTSSGLRQHGLKTPGRRGLSPGHCFSTGSSFYSSCLGLPSTFQHHDHLQHRSLVVASLKPPSGKGFGKKNLVEKKTPPESSEATSSSSSSSSRDPPVLGDVPSKSPKYRREEIDDHELVPEVVTNRMLKRIGLTVGVPLAFGLLLFPLFYYLKIVSKVDVPEWLPLFVSLFTFGTAGFGITYGVVSSSWDPAREGSLLGWKEAQVNWPLIWDKFQGNDKKK